MAYDSPELKQQLKLLWKFMDMYMKDQKGREELGTAGYDPKQHKKFHTIITGETMVKPSQLHSILLPVKKLYDDMAKEKQDIHGNALDQVKSLTEKVTPLFNDVRNPQLDALTAHHKSKLEGNLGAIAIYRKISQLIDQVLIDPRIHQTDPGLVPNGMDM